MPPSDELQGGADRPYPHAANRGGIRHRSRPRPVSIRDAIRRGCAVVLRNQIAAVDRYQPAACSAQAVERRPLQVDGNALRHDDAEHRRRGLARQIGVAADSLSLQGRTRQMEGRDRQGGFRFIVGRPADPHLLEPLHFRGLDADHRDRGNMAAVSGRRPLRAPSDGWRSASRRGRRPRSRTTA